MDVCLEEAEACLEKAKEPTSVEMKSVAVHEEVHKEDATVKPVGALRKRHRDQNLAVGCNEKPKEWTQSNGGSRRKLAAAHRGMTHHAGVARRKGHCHQGHGRGNAPSTQQERTDEKRRQAKPAGSHGIRNRDFMKQLRFGSERTSGGIYRKALVLEIAKQIAGSSARMWKMPVRKWEKRLHTKYEPEMKERRPLYVLFPLPTGETG
jgi:hypothetical protein